MVSARQTRHGARRARLAQFAQLGALIANRSEAPLALAQRITRQAALGALADEAEDLAQVALAVRAQSAAAFEAIVDCDLRGRSSTTAQKGPLHV